MVERPESEAPTGESRSRSAGWLAVVLVPALFFAFVELGLRAAGVGAETAFFIASPDGQAWSSNHHFGRRFFSADFQIHPDPLRLPRQKVSGEVRIVLLGGSAAFGDLDWGYGVGRFLEAMLRIRFPDRALHVVSGALPGANSHVMRGVATDALRLEPDLVLVYLGNNEVVGPYGTGSIVTDTADPSYQPRLWAIRTGLWIRSFRTGQALGDLLRGDPAQPDGASGVAPVGPLERPIRKDDPRLELTYEHFSRNLRDLITPPRAAGVPVLISTVPVNLRDVAPLRSLHAPDLSPELRREWEGWRARAAPLVSQGRSEEALALYDEAARIDGSFAALSFERAGALERAGRPADALAAYVRARDLDTLRARADTEINEILRHVARDFEGVELVDVDASWSAKPPPPGRDSFYDHCHLTLEGNHRLAASLFPTAVEAAGIAASDEQRRPPGLRRVRAELAVTAWDRYQLARRQATRGLFPGQARPEPPTLPEPAALERSRERYRSVLEMRPDDLQIRERLAELVLELGELEQVVAETDQLLARVEGVPHWLRLRGLARAGLGFPEEALADLDAALAIDSGFRRARLERAALRADLADWPGAIEDLESALSQKPGDSSARRELARARSASGDAEGAVDELLRILERRPDWVPARLDLARIERARGRPAEALPHLEHATRVEPEGSEALGALGHTYLDLGRREEAIAAYRRALAADPQDAGLARALRRALRERGGSPDR